MCSLDYDGKLLSILVECVSRVIRMLLDDTFITIYARLSHARHFRVLWRLVSTAIIVLCAP